MLQHITFTERFGVERVVGSLKCVALPSAATLPHFRTEEEEIILACTEREAERSRANVYLPQNGPSKHKEGSFIALIMQSEHVLKAGNISLRLGS